MIYLKLFSLTDILFFTLLFCPECWYDARTAFQGMREKIFWPEKVVGEGVEKVAETSAALTTVYDGNWATDSFDQIIPGFRMSVTSLRLQTPGFVVSCFACGV